MQKHTKFGIIILLVGTWNCLQLGCFCHDYNGILSHNPFSSTFFQIAFFVWLNLMLCAWEVSAGRGDRKATSKVFGKKTFRKADFGGKQQARQNLRGKSNAFTRILYNTSVKETTAATLETSRIQVYSMSFTLFLYLYRGTILQMQLFPGLPFLVYLIFLYLLDCSKKEHQNRTNWGLEIESRIWRKNVNKPFYFWLAQIVNRFLHPIGALSILFPDLRLLHFVFEQFQHSSIRFVPFIIIVIWFNFSWQSYI